MTRRSSSPRVLRNTLFACLLVALASCFFPFAARAQTPVIRFVRNPDLAPQFTAKDLDGKELSLEGVKGKVVLLNFWASWCGPCRAEIPSLIQLQEHYKGQLQIFGMVVDDDDEDEIRSLVKDKSINYPVAMASREVRIAYGGIAALPTVFVINTEGKVVQKHVGLFNPALYEVEVRALLGMPVPVSVETFEDSGEIFLKHADRASMLPGVKLSGLTPEQRTAALHKLNAESCTCGCNYTLAQCRIYDAACQISKDRSAAIVKEISGAEEKKPAPPDATPDAPAPSSKTADASTQ
jgi:thiol-disulfide isomerase/thioredoxin